MTALARLAACAAVAATTAGAVLVHSPAAVSAVSPAGVSQRYEIVATLDVATGTLDAFETLEITNRSREPIEHLDLSVIPRAPGYLEMSDGVRVGDLPASTTWTTNTNLRVTLPEPLGGDATTALELSFRLVVGTSPDAFGARLSRDAGVLSFGMWFPILSDEHDSYGLGDPQVSYTAERISLDLTTTTPLPRDAVACPGLSVAPDATGTHWVCDVDDVRDFSFVVNPSFRLTTREVGDTTIRVYTETVAGDVTADLAANALTRLGETYGAYPWPDLVVAEVGAGGGFSMEYPRSIHLTRSKVTDPYVVNHEVAHQWFYAQIGNDQMAEPWLDEAFADFSARYLMGIQPDHCSTRDVDSTVFAWPAELTTGGDWTSCDGYFHAVFYRGSEFLNAVRSAMGDDAFFAAMRAFVDEQRYGTTTTRELLDHLELTNDADLQPIFEAYLSAYDDAPTLRLLHADAPPVSLSR